MSEPTLSVVVTSWESASGEKGVFDRTRSAMQVAEVGVERMSTQTRHICEYIGTVFREASTSVAELELESLQVHVEVTATGELRLIGGVSTAVSGGLTLTFTRTRT